MTDDLITDGNRRRRRATGSYAAADARRAAVVEAASRLFAEQGYHQTSLAQVARAAGVSQTGLLHHFKGKDVLLLAVLRFHDGSRAARFDPPAHGLRRLLDHMLDVLREEVRSPELTRLFATTAGEATDPAHPAHDYFRRRFELMRMNNARAVRASIEAGLVKAEVDPKALGRVLVAVADGLMAQWLMDPSFDVVEHVRGHFEMLMRGIVTDGGGLTEP
ncbi:TetR/AcrR family transcriptional regulator [Streptomyces mirabilis]|uniref:Helix-turn-helix domain containing protein n=1 Tax=Streptomyces mirabilis TaxID=68239 RepID=A0ABU3V5F9_9ACTN|nr:helix-turn-helix domain containing protein [Streptomyces mirabilis]MCX5355753.1 TetR/AcrR family transcriptional regulator [Streptomyces mirabilis]MDU9001396.1 helix-turn-helix domain containing protein [Streptomyces mirabilis]